MRKKKLKNFESINTLFFIASEYYFGTSTQTIQFELNQNKMKKIFIANYLVLIISGLLLSSCTKTVGTNMNTPASTYTPGEIAGDPAFVGLNDALNHFDPHYLQLVYKDQRSTQEISDSSKALLLQLQANPESLTLQKQLADCYKLNSIAELKYYSDQIVINASAIKNKYFSKNKSFSDQDVNMYFKARSLYAKNKMDSVSNNTNRIKTSSMYDDYVLFPQPPAFTFFGEMDEEDANAGGDCKDECCYQWQACNTTARSKYIDGISNTSFNTSASGGVIGGAVGAVFSTAGSIGGSLFGVYFGSVLGASTAISIYSLDLHACDLLYKACIVKAKKSN